MVGDETMTTTQCELCFDEFTDSKQISCTKCNTSCCKSCFRNYILHCRNDPPCVNPKCDSIFEISFLREHLPRSFWDLDYKNSRKSVLVEHEEMYKDATMTEIARINQKTQIENDILKLEQEMVNIRRLIQDKKQDIWSLDHRQQPTKSSNKLRVPCHATDCLGFCIDNVCAICSKKTCDKCHGFLQDDGSHECKEDDLSTVKEICRNSRPCPSCNEAISKTEGCDQMLCTGCHTAFSWRTGKIDTGRIHNPHWYEIRRRVGRELADEVCGGLPDWRDLGSRIHKQHTMFISRGDMGHLLILGDELKTDIHDKIKSTVTSEQQTQTTQILNKIEDNLKIHHRLIGHLRGVVFPRFENLNLNYASNLQSRIKYYTQKIDKKTYEKELVKNEKLRTKNTEQRDLFQTFVLVSEEIYRKIYNDKQVDKSHTSELKGIYEYLCEHYDKINSKYGSKHRFENYIGHFRDFHKLYN